MVFVFNYYTDFILRVSGFNGKKYNKTKIKLIV